MPKGTRTIFLIIIKARASARCAKPQNRPLKHRAHRNEPLFPPLFALSYIMDFHDLAQFKTVLKMSQKYQVVNLNLAHVLY